MLNAKDSRSFKVTLGNDLDEISYTLDVFIPGNIRQQLTEDEILKQVLKSIRKNLKKLIT
jgi:hypothetical protein